MVGVFDNNYLITLINNLNPAQTLGTSTGHLFLDKNFIKGVLYGSNSCRRNRTFNHDQR